MFPYLPCAVEKQSEERRLLPVSSFAEGRSSAASTEWMAGLNPLTFDQRFEPKFRCIILRVLSIWGRESVLPGDRSTVGIEQNLCETGDQQGGITAVTAVNKHGRF